MITVSHDRYFLDNVVDRIFVFDGNGRLRQYEGGYTDYLEARQREAAGEDESPVQRKSPDEKKGQNKEWKQNRSVKLKFSYKEQKEFETIDDVIAALEQKIEALDADIMANATNSGRLNELTQQKEAAETQLEEKMERWIYLNDLAEKIEAQKN